MPCKLEVVRRHDHASTFCMANNHHTPFPGLYCTLKPCLPSNPLHCKMQLDNAPTHICPPAQAGRCATIEKERWSPGANIQTKQSCSVMKASTEKPFKARPWAICLTTSNDMPDKLIYVDSTRNNICGCTPPSARRSNPNIPIKARDAPPRTIPHSNSIPLPGPLPQTPIATPLTP